MGNDFISDVAVHGLPQLLQHSASEYVNQNIMNAHHHNHPLGMSMSAPPSSSSSLSTTNELLEDWPHRLSGDCWVVDANDQGGVPRRHRQPRRVVTFSKISSVQIYPHNPMDMRELTYTKEERKQCCSDAVAECLRIRKLLHSTPGGFNKDSFKCLIKNNIVALEDIVGIDHMVLGKSASLIKERQELVRSVVSAQFDIAMSDVEKLAAFCASKSSRAVKRARVRAALSCPRKEKDCSSSNSMEEDSDDAPLWSPNDTPMPPPRTSTPVDNKLIVTSSPLIASPSRSRRSSSSSSNRARIHTALAA